MKLKKQSAAALALAAVLVLGTTAAFATSPAPETENQGRVSQDIQSPISSGVQTPEGGSQTDEAPAAPIQTPAPETDTPGQVQTADPVTVSETEDPQAPAEPQVPETQAPAAPAEQSPAEKWNLPANGDIGDGEAFAVANEAEYQTLAGYLKEHYGLTDRDLHQRSNSDGTLTLRVSRATASSSEIESEWLENGDYKKNKYGETYGSSLLEYSVGYRPDLIAVIATDTRVSGFVDGTIMNGRYGYPYEINSREDARAYMEWLKTQPAERHLPVYDVDHETVVGTYIMYNDQSEDYVKSQEDIDFEIQAVTDMMKNQGYSDQEIQEYVQQMKADYAQ